MFVFFQFAGPDTRDVCRHQGDGDCVRTRHSGRIRGTEGKNVLPTFLDSIWIVVSYWDLGN